LIADRAVLKIREEEFAGPPAEVKRYAEVFLAKIRIITWIFCITH
jgi:hypothetical protein